MGLDPGWFSAAGAALLGFVGAWAALRVTVASLKDDVASLKELLLTVNTLQSQTKSVEVELERLRGGVHDLRNYVMTVSERVARLEAVSDGEQT